MARKQLDTPRSDYRYWLIVGLFVIGVGSAFLAVDRQSVVKDRATQSDSLARLVPKLARFDKPVFSEDDTKEFNREILVPMLNHAIAEDSIGGVRDDMQELRDRYRKGSLRIIISPDFFTKDGYEYREVGGRTVPNWRSDSGLDEIYVYLRNWQESGYFETIYRLYDVVITNFCHELEHVRSRETAGGNPRDQAITEEVRVWLSQLERILVPFEQEGRYLTKSQQDAIVMYRAVPEPEREIRFRRWVETSAAFSAYKRP